MTQNNISVNFGKRFCHQESFQPGRAGAFQKIAAVGKKENGWQYRLEEAAGVAQSLARLMNFWLWNIWVSRPGFLRSGYFLLVVAIWLMPGGLEIDAAETFRVAAYNVENYLDEPTASRPQVKSAAAKAKVRESIKAMSPDVLCLEEMGTTNALLELRASLKAEGLDYPFWDHVSGEDPNIHVAVLSRFPIISSHPHTNEAFLLDGRRFRVSRGFAEDEIQVSAHLSFTLIGVHLKSRRQSAVADEADLRLSEAGILRGIIDARLQADPEVKLVVLGDFNDVPNSASTREVMGRGKFRLFDTRPAERNGDDQPNPEPHREPRNVVWTHYYGVDDTYSRIDYILLSPAMKRDWRSTGTYIPTIPNWGMGSDHRPVIAEFTEDEQ